MESLSLRCYTHRGFGDMRNNIFGYLDPLGSYWRVSTKVEVLLWSLNEGSYITCASSLETPTGRQGTVVIGVTDKVTMRIVKVGVLTSLLRTTLRPASTVDNVNPASRNTYYTATIPRVLVYEVMQDFYLRE